MRDTLKRGLLLVLTAGVAYGACLLSGPWASYGLVFPGLIFAAFLLKPADVFSLGFAGAAATEAASAGDPVFFGWASLLRVSIVLMSALAFSWIAERAFSMRKKQAPRLIDTTHLLARESEELFRLVVEGTPNALLMTNEKGHIVLVNTQAEKLFGYTRDELIGKPVEMLVPQSVRTKHRKDRESFYGDLQARPMGAGRDLHGVRKDGTEVPLEIGLNPIRTRDGILVLAAIVDITQRKRAEEALKEADRRKDEFLAMLAHELRNPMAAISMASNLLSIPGVSEDKAKLARSSLTHRVHQLSRLVDDLLDVSRIIRGKIQLHKEDVDLAAVVQAAVETTRPFFEERNHQLRVETGDYLAAKGDPVRLEQILTNLLINAAKYTDNGGSISVSAKKRDGDAVIRVTDNGTGIPSSMLPNIFDLFLQADTSIHRSAGGLGVGLSVARTLAEMHGGTLTAKSEGLGKGSEFTLRLPLLRIPTSEEKSIAAVEPGLNILVVEDHKDTAFLEAADLQLKGHATDIAYDGPSGLEKALTVRPDVILLDIGLPGLNGFEVARRLRQSGLKDTLIIAVTGYGQERDYEQSREAGIDYHVLKPLEYVKVAAFLACYQRKKQGKVASYH